MREMLGESILDFIFHSQHLYCCKLVLQYLWYICSLKWYTCRFEDGQEIGEGP
jgi:hypothetical protein